MTSLTHLQRVETQGAFDSYADNRDTGGFILIDRLSNVLDSGPAVEP